MPIHEARRGKCTLGKYWPSSTGGQETRGDIVVFENLEPICSRTPYLLTDVHWLSYPVGNGMKTRTGRLYPLKRVIKCRSTGARYREIYRL